MISLGTNQNIDGNSNQQALRDINNNTFNLPLPMRRDSAIERVLTGLYDLTESQQLSFTPLDTRTYTVHDKIDHNKLEAYREFYDQFAAVHPLVQHKINIASSSDPSFRTKIIVYVQGVHRKIVMAMRSSAVDVQLSPDTIVQKISTQMQQDLQSCQASITLEELEATDYVVFYVFAECKIFEKPPAK